MSGANTAPDAARITSACFPFRRTMVVVESLVGLAGLTGSIQLLAGVATPPATVFSPLGLASWTLPAGWLFLTVALPSGLAAWLAWRRSPWAPTAVLVASALLAAELLVQIPFLGFSVLQLIFGTVAIGMAVLGLGVGPGRAVHLEVEQGGDQEAASGGVEHRGHQDREGQHPDHEARRTRRSARCR
jgi:hypothetical protein